MSSSTPAPRFLLDENVRVELDHFLRDKGFFVERLSKGASDRSLAAASRDKKLTIVTNDEDFASMTTASVFAVVLLRIPQRDASALFSAFHRLLRECKRWEGQMLILMVHHWKVSKLAAKRATRKAA